METINRDEVLVQLRPFIQTPDSPTAIEAFQNNVLRPILKFQNEFLVANARTYIKKRHKEFNALKKSAQEALIIQASKQDHEFRSQLIWPIVAMVTTEELTFYSENSSELNKRITAMAVQRINSQIERLY